MNKIPSYQYVVMVMGPAYGTQSSYCAYQCCRSLLTQSHHSLKSIFFYADGIYNANRLTDPANDEFDLIKAWQVLAQQHHIKLSVCIAAAQRRGVVDSEDANNLANGFELVGLGELSDAIQQSDRVLQF